MYVCMSFSYFIMILKMKDKFLQNCENFYYLGTFCQDYLKGELSGAQSCPVFLDYDWTLNCSGSKELCSCIMVLKVCLL